MPIAAGAGSDGSVTSWTGPAVSATLTLTRINSSPPVVPRGASSPSRSSGGNPVCACAGWLVSAKRHQPSVDIFDVDHAAEHHRRVELAAQNPEHVRQSGLSGHRQSPVLG